MRAVLKPRRFFAVLLVFVLLCPAASALGDTWIKRITTQTAEMGADMVVRGTATGELAIPSERVEKYGVGLLIGDPPDQQSGGFSVSGTPDVDVTLNGDDFTFGVGVYAWEQSNTVTLNGGSIRTTTTEEESSRDWGGMTGLRLMAAPGGVAKVKSTADISVISPGSANVYNIGVWLRPENSIFTAFYELDGNIVPVTSNMDYDFLSERLHECTVTEGSETCTRYVQISPDNTKLTFFDENFNEIGTATETKDKIRSFQIPTFIPGIPPTIGRIPLQNLAVTLADGSGTATWNKVAYVKAMDYKADTHENHVYLLNDRVYIWEKRTFAPVVSADNRPRQMEVELGGTVSVEGIRARGLEISSLENTKAAASLLSGTALSTKGSYTQAMYLSTVPDSLAPLTVKGGGNVSLVSESNTGCASGIIIIARETDASVSITGTGNKMTVTSTTNEVSGPGAIGEKPQQASAFLLRPAEEDNRVAVRFEGDVDVRGGQINGIYATPIMGGIVRMELIGDLTLTDSAGDGIYQAYNGEIPLGGVDIPDGKGCEVYLRGNINLVNARGESWRRGAAGVTLRAGLALVDGDVTATGTGTLRGIYADSIYEDAVVVVTGEVKGPVPIRIPKGDEKLPNYARVYVWKTDLDACQNEDDRIGFVLKIDEEQPALKNVTLSCDSAGNRFLDPITWEGRTYYGAFAGDEITISSFPSGYRAVVKDADGNPVEVTEKDGKYTFLTPATCGAMVTLEPVITYSITEGNGATWTKGSAEGLDFTAKGSPDDSQTFAKFTGIEVDGTAVAAANYTAAEGSVKLNLKASYLESLPEGKHSLMVLFKDGKAEGTFYIQAPAPAPVPKTGDSANPALWLGLAVIGFIGLLLAGIKKSSRSR